jgi:hypothetical protein
MRKMNRNVVSLVFGLAVLLVIGLAVPGVAGEKALKIKKDHAPGAHSAQIKITDGNDQPEAVRGTQWVIYDDGTREGWGGDYAPNSGAAGNKFTSTWGTFYCDMMSGFAIWTGTGSSAFFSMWTGTTNTGADLTGNIYETFSGLSSSASGWVQMDGSTSSIGFIGNTTATFNNTAWLGMYVYSSTEIPGRAARANDVGIDTNGGGSRGFYVDYYSGTGYNEMSWDAMVRARFNGDNVPVELMGFTVE